jgi:hypothetical protein
MGLVYKDRIKETNNVVGTTDIVLLGTNPVGFRTFSSVMANGDTCYYAIDDGAGNWEVGLGTYASAGTLLARTRVDSSSAGGAKISFGVGTKNIFMDVPAGLFPTGDATNTQLVLGADSRFEKKPVNYADLVLNGLGQLRNNTNWSAWGVDLLNFPPGASASFTNSTLNVVKETDEFIYVDPQRNYRAVLNAKATALGTGCLFYGGINCYDVDSNPIVVYNHASYTNSAQAVLTRAVQAGDTAIYISDGTGWAANVAPTAQRGIRLGNYKNSLGYTYSVADGMYTRLFLYGGATVGDPNFGTALWNQSASSITNIGGGEWRIDLAAPVGTFNAAMVANYGGTTIPIGTPVENATTGSTYKYIFGAAMPITGTWATAWQRFEATIGGIDLSRTNNFFKFAPGTVKVKPVFLPNTSGSVAGTTAVSVSFAPVVVNPSRLVNDSNPVPKVSSVLVNVYGALTDGYSDVRLLAWLDDVRLNKEIQFVFNFNTAAVGGGAGTVVDANILAAMRQLKAYGAEIAGYVDTGYGSKTFDQIITGAIQWRNLYGDLPDYIFGDQFGGADTSVNRLFYKAVRQRLEDLGFGVMFNAGSPLLTSWYKVSGDDVIGDNAILCISEGNTAPIEADEAGYIASHLFVLKKQLMIILKNQTLVYLTSVLPTIRKHYGWFSFADDNVYSSRPVWLRDVLGQLKTNTKSVSINIAIPSQVVKIPVPLEAGGFSNLQFKRLAYDTTDFQSDEFELEPVTVNPYRDAVTNTQGFMIVPVQQQSFLVGTFIVYYQS